MPIYLRLMPSCLPEEHHAVGVGAKAVVLDAPDVGGLGEGLH